MLEKIEFKPIGIIHSPYRELRGTPIQPEAAKDTEGRVEVFPAFASGLKDLDGFSHIFLLYYFHKARKADLLQKPFMDDSLRGVFAIRSPSRPNPIGLSVVRILSVEDSIITVRGLDVVDGTPLLDIKPYLPEFDVFDVDKKGWLEENVHKLRSSRDDGRFSR